MHEYIKKVKKIFKAELNPEKPEERKKIIKEAVERTVNEYGEALKKLGAD